VHARALTPSDVAAGAWSGQRTRVGVRFRGPSVIDAARFAPCQLGRVDAASVPAVNDAGRGQQDPCGRGRLSGPASRSACGARDRCLLSASVACVPESCRRPSPRRVGAIAQCRFVELPADTQYRQYACSCTRVHGQE
jgi:hypothetical protein